MSYKQHPNAGMIHEDEQRFTTILPKWVVAGIRNISHLEGRSMKSVYTEALTGFLQNYWGGPKRIPVEVVGMSDLTVRIATVDDRRWCLSLGIDLFGGKYPKMGERMFITLEQDHQEESNE